jgi:hypothetical protein
VPSAEIFNQGFDKTQTIASTSAVTVDEVSGIGKTTVSLAAKHPITFD